MDSLELLALLRASEIEAEVLEGEPLSRHTSFQIGGPAAVMLVPKTAEALAAAAVLLKKRKIPFFVLGKGTNLVLPDAGLSRLVLKTAEAGAGCSVKGEVLTCGAGCSVTAAAVFAQKQGLSGLEFAYGIPGTVGGAVYMNAGAYGGEMAQIVTETTFVDERGALSVMAGAEHRFAYRRSAFSQRDTVLLETKLQLKQGDCREIAEKMEELMARRREKQPLELPSAGSVFKRPQGFFAGKLIADAGLRGVSVGGAMVSPKHAGFIVNTGGATARDVGLLIEKIQQTVLRETGILLECEIKRL